MNIIMRLQIKWKKSLPFENYPKSSKKRKLSIVSLCIIILIGQSFYSGLTRTLIKQTNNKSAHENLLQRMTVKEIYIYILVRNT